MPTEDQIEELAGLLEKYDISKEKFEEIEHINIQNCTREEFEHALKHFKNLILAYDGKTLANFKQEQETQKQQVQTPLIKNTPNNNTPNNTSKQEKPEQKPETEKPIEKPIEKPSQQINPVQKINSDLSNQAEPYQIFDILDSEQIVEYMETALDQSYFYSMYREGREIFGISYAGTIAVAKALVAKRKANGEGGIEVLPDIIINETPDTYRAIVRAKDKSIDLTVVGTSEQPKLRKICEKKDYTTGKCIQYRTEPDPFAYTIAVSKASRNALRQLIPEEAILQLYSDWKKKKR